MKEVMKENEEVIILIYLNLYDSPSIVTDQTLLSH